MPDIVVVGSLNMDLVVRVKSLPAPGETVPGGDLRTICGGKGANQAAASARLGSQVAMIGRVGEDAFGARLREALDSAGVDTRAVQGDPAAATGTAVIEVDERGENTIVISPGTNGRVSPADIDQFEGLIAGAKVMLLQLEIPVETVLHALEAASKYPTRVILNPAPVRVLPREIFSRVDYLVPNETELQRLTGMPADTLEAVERAARELVGWGARAVIVTLGEKGSLAVTHDGRQHVPAFKVTPVDTTAAGDAFIGGFATGLVRGLPLEEAVRIGNAAGALAVTRFGAQTSLPDLSEVEAILRTV